MHHLHITQTPSVTPEPSPQGDDVTPLPARGWTAERKARFLDHLAIRGHVRAACARVGLSAESAYRLRRRDPLFARAWAAAIVLAREACTQILADRAIDGVEEQVWHRGELVGSRRRYDARLLLAHIGRLERLAEEAAGEDDTARFDELVARIAGEDIPDSLPSEDGMLPLPREEAVRLAENSARLEERWAAEDEAAADAGLPDPWGDDEDEYDPDLDEEEALRDPEYAAQRAAEHEAALEAQQREEELTARIEGAARRARAADEAAWDGWFAQCCARVDRASGWSGAPPAPGLPSGPHLPRRAPDLPAFAKPAENSPRRTVSTVSTSALARALAHTMPHGRSGGGTSPRSPFSAPR